MKKSLVILMLTLMLAAGAQARTRTTQSKLGNAKAVVISGTGISPVMSFCSRSG